MKKKLIDFNFTVELGDEELRSFVALQGDKNFVVFREKINELLIMRATDFMTGVPLPEGITSAQDYYRGMGSFWKAALRLVDSADKAISEREKDKK